MARDKAEIDAKHNKKVSITIEDAPPGGGGSSADEPDVQAFAASSTISIRVGDKILTITIAE
jgi:hypothetical protein